MTKQAAFTKIRELFPLAGKATVQFSGGHDEGGAEWVVVELADGTEESVASSYWRGDEATDRQKAEGELYDLLEEPIRDEYGSFAGDFSVSGTVIYDLAADTITMAKSEQSWGDSSTTVIA